MNITSEERYNLEVWYVLDKINYKLLCNKKDKVIKMVFSNFVVKDEKVLSYNLNPNFVRYLKPNCHLVSGKEDLNLRPHGPKPRALAN